MKMMRVVFNFIPRELWEDTSVSATVRSAGNYADDARGMRRRYRKGVDQEFQLSWYLSRVELALRLVRQADKQRNLIKQTALTGFEAEAYLNQRAANSCEGYDPAGSAVFSDAESLDRLLAKLSLVQEETRLFSGLPRLGANLERVYEKVQECKGRNWICVEQVTF